MEIRNTVELHQEDEAKLFDDLKLSDIDWGQGEKVFRTRIPIEYQGKRYELAATKFVDERETEFKFKLDRMGATIELKVRLVPATKEDHIVPIQNFDSETNIKGGFVTAYTEIRKINRKKHLPQGIGLEFFKKVFPFCQDTAEQSEVPVRHWVHNSSKTGAEKLFMDPTSWDKVFIPVLEEKGYEQGPDKYAKDWIKNYLPESSDHEYIPPWPK